MAPVRNILIIGPAAAGKTTIGNQIADHTGATIFRIDDYKHHPNPWRALATEAARTPDPKIVECCRSHPGYVRHAIGPDRAIVRVTASQQARTNRLTQRGWHTDHIARAVREPTLGRADITVDTTTGTVDIPSIIATVGDQPEPPHITARRVPRLWHQDG